jgi:Flp pilus assembly protein protease CpaA
MDSARRETDPRLAAARSLQTNSPVLARNYRLPHSAAMNLVHLWEQIRFHLLLHGSQYKFYIESAAIAVLFYVGYTDFRTFKIRNGCVLLLLVLYALLALVDRTPSEVVANVLLGVAMFAILLFFYTRGVVGGGDVKLLAVVSLWIKAGHAVPFSILLLGFICLHVVMAKLSWVPTKQMAGSAAISFGPAAAAALIGAIITGGV